MKPIQTTTLKFGDKAPDFCLKDQNNQTHNRTIKYIAHKTRHWVIAGWEAFNSPNGYPGLLPNAHNSIVMAHNKKNKARLLQNMSLISYLCEL